MAKVMLWPIRDYYGNENCIIAYIGENDGTLNPEEIYEIPDSLKEEHFAAEIALEEIKDKIIALKPVKG